MLPSACSRWKMSYLPCCNASASSASAAARPRTSAARTARRSERSCAARHAATAAPRSKTTSAQLLAVAVGSLPRPRARGISSVGASANVGSSRPRHVSMRAASARRRTTAVRPAHRRRARRRWRCVLGRSNQRRLGVVHRRLGRECAAAGRPLRRRDCRAGPTSRSLPAGRTRTRQYPAQLAHRTSATSVISCERPSAPLRRRPPRPGATRPARSWSRRSAARPAPSWSCCA